MNEETIESVNTFISVSDVKFGGIAQCDHSYCQN